MFAPRFQLYSSSAIFWSLSTINAACDVCSNSTLGAFNGATEIKGVDGQPTTCQQVFDDIDTANIEPDSTECYNLNFAAELGEGGLFDVPCAEEVFVSFACLDVNKCLDETAETTDDDTDSDLCLISEAEILEEKENCNACAT